MLFSKVPVATLGVPRIGRHRELKHALESYWSGKSSEEALLEAASKLRAQNWMEQQRRGVTKIPSNDFSLYDHVLDTAVMVGAIPPAYGTAGGAITLDTYFAMARGSEAGAAACGAATSPISAGGPPCPPVRAGRRRNPGPSTYRTLHR